MTNMFPAMKIIIVLTIFFCFAMYSNKIMTERKVERRREKCDDQSWTKQKIEVSSSIEKEADCFTCMLVKTKKLNDMIYAFKDDDEKTTGVRVDNYNNVVNMTGVKIDVSTSHKETESNEYENEYEKEYEIEQEDDKRPTGVEIKQQAQECHKNEQKYEKESTKQNKQKYKKESNEQKYKKESKKQNDLYFD